MRRTPVIAFITFAFFFAIIDVSVCLANGYISLRFGYTPFDGWVLAIVNSLILLIIVIYLIIKALKH